MFHTFILTTLNQCHVFCQGDLINNIEKNVTGAVEFVDQSKAETHRAITFKKNRYKIASLPDFLKSSKSKTTKTHQKSEHLDQN